MLTELVRPGTWRETNTLRGLRSGWLAQRERIAVACFALIGLTPLVYIFSQIAGATSNVAYWDEIDTAIALVLRLQTGMSFENFLGELFALNNEHRMLTSRLVFANSYWLTGTLDFVVIAAIGNAAFIAMLVVLIASAQDLARRVRMGVVLGLGLVQMEHYENFLWSGSSIDHFQVPLLATVAIVGIAGGTRAGVLFAGLCAFLATFTLTHGILLWPLGAWMLQRAGRRRALFGWCALALASIGGFLVGFEVNGSHRFADLSLSGLLLIIRYWLTLVGAVPALGNLHVAPWLGGLLLLAIGWLGWRGAARRETIAFPLALFAIGALGMIAVGRAELSGGTVYSRYMVLSGLAWTMTLFIWLDRFSHPQRPYALLARTVPLLVLFNITANAAFAPKAAAWVECRDWAVLSFKHHGVDGKGPFQLYPIAERSTALLNEAERRGVFRLAPLCVPKAMPAAKPSGRIAYFVDELNVNPRAAYISGWAGIPGIDAQRGDIQLILKSETATHVFGTVAASRPDVAKALGDPGFADSGFRFAKRRDLMPTGEFQVGFILTGDKGPEYIMTDHRLHLVAEVHPDLAMGN